MTAQLTPEQISQIVDAAPGVPIPRFKVYTSLEARNMPAPDYIIDGLLQERGATVLHGRGNVAKSFIALDWAAHLATGLNWMNRPTKQGAVIYASLESTVPTRLDAWQQHHQIDNLDNLFWIFEGINLRDPECVDQLISEARSRDAILVIIDTLARSMPGFKEIASEEMGLALDALDRLRLEAQTATNLIHHEPYVANRPRGHSSLYDGVDTTIGVTRTDTGLITIEVGKQRNGGNIGEKVFMSLEDVDDRPGAAVLGPTKANELLAQQSDSVHQLGQLMGQHPNLIGASHTKLKTAAKDILNMSPSTFKWALNKLTEQGFWTNAGDTKHTSYYPAEYLATLPEPPHNKS